MSNIHMPGAVWNIITVGLIAAAGAGIEYFSAGGAGNGYLYATIVVAAFQTIIKYLSEPTEPPAAAARGMESSAAQRSKMSRFLLG